MDRSSHFPGADFWSGFVLGQTPAVGSCRVGAGVLQGFFGCEHQLAQLGRFLLSFSGGRSSSSPVTSSGGTPSPLNPLLSPSCSPPTFHLSASNIGVSCPETYLHNLNVPLYYKICPTSFLRQQSLIFPSHEKLGGTNPHLVPHFTVDMPKLSSLGITNLKNAKAEDLNGQCLQVPNSASQMLYGLHASGNIFPSSPIAREALNCSLHPPYGLYGYNFSVPSRLMSAASHFKVSDSIPASLRDGRCNHSNWHPTINHCL